MRLKANLFASIFLLYPAISTTLFRAPQCLELGDDSYHEEDFDIDCTRFAGPLTSRTYNNFLAPLGN